MGAVINIDTNSAEWSAVKAYAERRLIDAMSGLKNPSLGHDRTQVLRGQVWELEQLLALPDSLAIVKQVDSPGY